MLAEVTARAKQPTAKVVFGRDGGSVGKEAGVFDKLVERNIEAPTRNCARNLNKSILTHFVRTRYSVKDCHRFVVSGLRQ